LEVYTDLDLHSFVMAPGGIRSSAGEHPAMLLPVAPNVRGSPSV
jgi:hypothetical protein